MTELDRERLRVFAEGARKINAIVHVGAQTILALLAMVDERDRLKKALKLLSSGYYECILDLQHWQTGDNSQSGIAAAIERHKEAISIAYPPNAEKAADSKCSPSVGLFPASAQGEPGSAAPISEKAASVCSTCNGLGEVYERTGGYPLPRTRSPCPDCTEKAAPNNDPHLCAGGVRLSSERCPKCGASDEDFCRYDEKAAPGSCSSPVSRSLDEPSGDAADRKTAGPGAAELLPCPFCGGEPVLDDTVHGYQTVIHCSNCEASSDWLNAQEAITAWNKRSSQSEAERLREALCFGRLQAFAEIEGWHNEKKAEWDKALATTPQVTQHHIVLNKAWSKSHEIAAAHARQLAQKTAISQKEDGQ